MPVFVITGPSGVGKGTLIRDLLRARARARAVGVRDHARSRGPGRPTASTTTSSPTTSSSARVARGRVRRARPLLGPPLRHAALRARAAARRRRARCVLEIEVQGARQVREAMPEAVAGLHRAAAARRRCATRLVGRGTDSPEEVEARLATAARGARARSTSSRTSSSTTGSRTRWPSSRRWSAAAARTECVAPYGGTALDLTPRRQLLEHVDSPYASVIVAAKRARQINSLLPQPRRGHVRGVPAADGRHRLQELPDDRARRGRERQDQVPLPRLIAAGRMARSCSASPAGSPPTRRWS